MCGGLAMKDQDLVELYQLLHLYWRTYPENADRSLKEIISDIERKYREQSGGKEIKGISNPRSAGRKKKYTQKQDAQIKRLYKEGNSMRQIAEKAGCSLGHVQDVIHRGESKPRVYGN